MGNLPNVAVVGQELYDQLFSNFITYNQVIKAYRYFRSYFNDVIYAKKTAADAEKFFVENGVEGLYKEWLQSVVQRSANLALDPVSFTRQLADLKEVIERQPKVTLYTAFEFPDYRLAELQAKIISTLGKKMLVDIKYDQDLLAGCALVWNGQYTDFSLRGDLERRREEVIKVLTNFQKI